MWYPVRWLLAKAGHLKAARMRREFLSIIRRPREHQEKLLLEQIQRERQTAFGRDHGFAEIKTLADFRRRLPISRYEYFQPYIERVMKGETEALFHRQRVLMFAMTSGTTSARKYVPVTDRFLADYRRGWMVWGVHIYERYPKLWFRAMIQLVGDWQEQFTPAGVPCGSISGLTSHVQMRIVRRQYVLPPESGKIKDVRVKYYLACRLGLQRDVAMILSANPSTMVGLGRFMDEHGEELIRNLHDGGLSEKFALPEVVRTAVASQTAPNRTRARELDEIWQKTGRLLPKDVWPNLGVIGNWTGGSVGGYMRQYPEFYDPQTPIRDLGLVASEGRMTIPVEDNTSSGALDVGSAFFEFVPVDEIDSSMPTVLLAHELEEGRDYYILLTTSSGLYRYNIFDVVRCTGWLERTPMLAFLNKGSNFSNLTGEKLSEFQVVQAVEAASKETGVAISVYTAAPCWTEPVPYYGFLLEETDFKDGCSPAVFARVVDQKLQEGNDEYASKRQSLRLQPARVLLLPAGTWSDWDRKRLLHTGGTPEQYKHPCLIPDVEFPKSMPVVVEAS